MLKDQDRIFTNLYGMHDRTLAGAKKRGHWDGTAGILARGRDTIVDQIASWKARDIAFVDERMVGFHGRISRDEWVKQARILARGGATEFSARVKKGGVY